MHDPDVRHTKKTVKIARSELSELCTNNLEHIGAVTSDMQFHNLTTNSGINSVDYSRDMLEPLCLSEKIHFFHCHVEDLPWIEFPSDNDLKLFIDTEYYCASTAIENKMNPPEIKHSILVKKKSPVNYGLHDTSQIRELAKEQGTFVEKMGRSFSELGDILKQQRERNATIASMQEEIGNVHWDNFTAYIKETCPNIETKEDLLNCDMSLKEFIESLPEDNPYFITKGKKHRKKAARIVPRPSSETPLQKISASSISSEEAIEIVTRPKYPPGIVELTPDNFSEFINQDKAMVVRCAEESIDYPSCQEAVEFAIESGRYCWGLKAGMIDVDENPSLRAEKYESIILETVELFHNGYKTDITLPRFDSEWFGRIFCGQQLDYLGRPMYPGNSFLYPGNSHNPLDSLYEALESIERALGQ